MEKDTLEELISHIPSSITSTRNLECCCGRKECAYLNHNCSALDDLEKELHTAATLGQVRYIPRPTLDCIAWRVPDLYHRVFF
jgi:hypothetical protein